MIATTGGYIGDAPPYQGHVAVIDAASGKLLHVWNSLCSNRTGLIDPASCGASDSAIWGRAGAVIDPTNGNLLRRDGQRAVGRPHELGRRGARASRRTRRGCSATTRPTNTDELNASDADLGSTSPVLLGGGYLAQGGKDGKIRVLSIKRMSGTSPHKDGELQVVSTPSGTDLFTAPAVWHTASATWMFAADNGGTAAWRFRNAHLTQVWRNGTGGTSPVVAGGLLWVYSPGGGLNVYVPGDGQARDDAAVRRRPLEQPDRRRRPRRASRGERERPRDERRARHLASALESRAGSAGIRSRGFRHARRP